MRTGWQGTDATGHPIVYRLHNAEAALGTRTQPLYGQNATGLVLNGASTFISGKLGLWDGGLVLTTHREFGGRIQQRNITGTLSDHATHMAGTLVAQGLNPTARGMANGASLQVWDYTNDLAELTTAAPSLLLSVHAYGPLAGWVQNLERTGTDPNLKWEWWGNTALSQTEDYLFGFYTAKARDIDHLAYTNPYYLMVRSADNKRTETGPLSGVPYFLANTNTQSTALRSRNDSYDVIPAEATAKNVLTVGAADVTLNSNNDPTYLSASPYSGWGPTDDGRIKPDLLGIGTGIYSTLSTGTTAYGINTGTSMAAANVTGSLLLLQELFARQTNGRFLRAATLRGLAIHTADRLSPELGPDYRQGWGLLNTTAAAAVIQNLNQGNQISEQTLPNTRTYTLNVVAQGNQPLVVTLSWTDPEGPVSSLVPASVNSRTPKLVNDLDLRVTATGQTTLPYVLNPNRPADAASRGDNIRDNVEQVYIAKPVAGQTYTVLVSHKNTLRDAGQPFSVIVSGQKERACSLPARSILDRPDTTLCAGTTLLLKTDDVPGLHYEWLQDGQLTPAPDAPETPVQTGGSYMLRYTDQVSGCVGTSAPVRVKLFSPQVRLSPATNLYLCSDKATAPLSATTDAGSTIAWLRNGQPLAGATSMSIAVAQPGLYSAQITLRNCVAKSAAVVAQLTTVGTPELLPTEDDIQLPNGASIRLIGPTGTDFQYQWLRDKQPLVGASERQLLVNAPGAYRLQITQQQCIGISAEKTVRRSSWGGLSSLPDSLVAFDGADSTFVVYPNPTPNTLFVRYVRPGATAVSVTVYDIIGNIQKEAIPLRFRQGLFYLDMPVSDLPLGLYLLHLTDGSRSKSVRFLKE